MEPKPQVGGTAPFDLLAQVRKYIPFSHGWRLNQKDGRGQMVNFVAASPNVDTNIKLSLGHTPQGYIVLGATVAGIVYFGSNQGTDWTPIKIVLRASAAGGYNLWVF